MKIICLVENTCFNDSFECEHGLSLFIQTKKHNVLFDMGQTDLFAKNADKLGIDLKTVDIAILSHGHYDHGGGLKTFLDINSTAKVYINENAFKPYYNGTEKYIGLDISLADNERIVFVSDEFAIDDELFLLSENKKERTNSIETPNNLKILKNGTFVDDEFLHEHYLVIKENGRSMLVTGCAHKGIFNILDWQKPYAVVGGFHLSNVDTGKISQSMLDACNKNTKKFYTGHCTGEIQYQYLKEHLGNVDYISTGKIIEL